MSYTAAVVWVLETMGGGRARPRRWMDGRKTMIAGLVGRTLSIDLLNSTARSYMYSFQHLLLERLLHIFKVN